MWFEGERKLPICLWVVEKRAKTWGGLRKKNLEGKLEENIKYFWKDFRRWKRDEMVVRVSDAGSVCVYFCPLKTFFLSDLSLVRESELGKPKGE